MKVLWGKEERKAFEQQAWGYVKHLNAPRHVRMLMRDALMKDLMEQAERDLNTETTPEMEGTVTG